MGYNIELSFDILKHSSISEIQNIIKELANKNKCNYCYEDYEYETNVQYKRQHCIMTTHFENSNIKYLVEFLKNISNMEGLHIEVIFDEELNKILYASKYYQTQKMNKYIVKEYNSNKRERSYSEDDTLILDAINKNFNRNINKI
jgi:hypothetical protein